MTFMSLAIFLLFTEIPQSLFIFLRIFLGFVIFLRYPLVPTLLYFTLLYITLLHYYRTPLLPGEVVG